MSRVRSRLAICRRPWTLTLPNHVACLDNLWIASILDQNFWKTQSRIEKIFCASEFADRRYFDIGQATAGKCFARWNSSSVSSRGAAADRFVRSGETGDERSLCGGATVRPGREIPIHRQGGARKRQPSRAPACSSACTMPVSPLTSAAGTASRIATVPAT